MTKRLMLIGLGVWCIVLPAWAADLTADFPETSGSTKTPPVVSEPPAETGAEDTLGLAPALPLEAGSEPELTTPQPSPEPPATLTTEAASPPASPPSLGGPAPAMPPTVITPPSPTTAVTSPAEVPAAPPATVAQPEPVPSASPPSPVSEPPIETMPLEATPDVAAEAAVAMPAPTPPPPTELEPTEEGAAGAIPIVTTGPAELEIPPEETATLGETSEPHGAATPAVSTPMRGVDEEMIKALEKKREEEGVHFNVAGEDIREIIKQISRLTGKNFILDDKVRGEITIISEQKMTPDEVYEAFLSALDVIGYTTITGPAGLIKIVKQRDALTKPIPIYTEDSPYTDKFITRLMTLKSVSALDMSNAIKGLISREGNLFAYPATNTLIITDTGSNIERIIQLVEQLDTEGPQEILEIIPIRYAVVDDIADKVRELFGEESGDKAAARTPPRRGRPGAEEIEALPAVGKVISDSRTNSLIILASKLAIVRVRNVIARLDTPLAGPDEGDIHVLYLKNSKATELAEVLTGVTQAAKSSRDQSKGAAKTAPKIPQVEFEGLFGSISSIKADDDTNALIIQANSKDFRTLVDNIISKLDIPRRQVYIEALIMELSIRDSMSLGTGALGGKTFNVAGGELALFGNSFPFLGDILTTSGAGAASTSDPIGITAPFSDSVINFPRFFAAFMAQQEDTELNVLSTPNILTLDNSQARIKVGDTVPFKTGSAVTTGGLATSNIQREDIALELDVTPQITEGNNVRLKIKQTVEDFSDVSNPLAAEAGPATSKREIESEVVIPDQNTVVLGGLMQDKMSKTETKVPLLGDIPILGYLFKGTQKAKRKVNLLIFLTPSIVREPQDFLAMLQRKIQQRNDFIDSNFGKGARNRIREIIQRHNERLLDFQTAAAFSDFDRLEPMPTSGLDGSKATHRTAAAEPEIVPDPEEAAIVGEPRIADEPPIQ